NGDTQGGVLGWVAVVAVHENGEAAFFECERRCQVTRDKARTRPGHGPGHERRKLIEPLGRGHGQQTRAYFTKGVQLLSRVGNADRCATERGVWRRRG